ncbi:MAG: hypothetical protein ABIE81_04110 [Candidatus Omnitrophota bacterium]
MGKIPKYIICMPLILVMLMQFGCVSIRTYEKQQYRDLEYKLKALGLEPEKSKDPTMAAVLNILPGFGNLYLEQWGPFIGNLLFWPLSVVWGVPQAAIDAKSINIQETLYFYNFGPGKQKLEELEKNKSISNTQTTTVTPPKQENVSAPTNNNSKETK